MWRVALASALVDGKPITLDSPVATEPVVPRNTPNKAGNGSPPPLTTWGMCSIQMPALWPNQDADDICACSASAAQVGMALIPEDRKTEGLMLPMTVRENLSFAVLDRISKGGVINREKEGLLIDEMVRLLAIKTDGLDGPVGALSGGNQQKVVIAKWLMRRPRIILLNDPTRGIDVGTKHELYQLLRRLADAGAAILFYSTDYDELIGCCDRVLVLYDGRILRELVGDGITQHDLIASALNVDGKTKETAA
jgi:ribose transport system ATP-binding protein